jgi:hypothetical protein
MELGLYSSLAARAVSIAATGILHGHVPSRPIDVIRFGLIVTTAATVSGTFLLKRRPTPGSASGEVTLGTVTMVTASRAIGSVLFADVNAAVSRINPGAEVVIDCTVAATTGVATMFLDFQQRGLHKRDLSSAYYAKLFDSNPTVG